MKNFKILILAFVTLCTVISCTNQSKQVSANDPLNTKIYTLKNGLTVYMSVNKATPRIQTYIVVKAGSKNDPADATGLAHYLEHMLFKGTDKYGSKDFSKEGPLIAKIDSLFEVYRATTDSAQRVKIYAIIDSVSYEASKYAIPNEYDKMLASIGAVGTNANTSYDRTMYVNDIPSNQINNWLTVEAERFRHPVMRLFHTELEAVYEEKNRTLDNDDVKAWYALLGGLFKKHTYGTQSVIGTIDHLKNPSLKKIMEYYNTYYVPNNMAICLSGDFDPDSTLKMIEEKFESLPSKEVPKFTFEPEDSITTPIEKEVWGPFPVSVSLGYRFPGFNSNTKPMLAMVDMILSNSAAGLIDLNINQKQLALGAGSGVMDLKDYCIHLIFAQPKEGQTLEQAKDLLLQQIELVKKGDFADWLIPAIVANYKKDQIEKYEGNKGRANAFAESFMYDKPWNEYITFTDKLSKISKQDVMDFAKKYYGNNYVAVYKRKGVDTTVVKVTKPKITPVVLNKEDHSTFSQSITDSKPTPVKPEFLDYKKDIQHLTLEGSSISILYKKNDENDIFDLYYKYNMGTNNDKKWEIAMDYLPYLGTKQNTAEQIQQEFYKLACSYDFSASTDEVTVHLTGLNENFSKALVLLEDYMVNAQPDKTILDNLVNDILKDRTNAMQDKNIILQKALKNYGMYGPVSPFTNILSETELKALNPDELITMIHDLNSYAHHILYYGPSPEDSLKNSLKNGHKVPAQFKTPESAIVFTQLPTEQTKVYVVDYPMQQAEIVMLSKGNAYDKTIEPYDAIFNDYFGTGMSSLVFQEIRESKALAYSAYAYYLNPARQNDAHYTVMYVGTQADKLPEAMKGITELINNMPEVSTNFEATKSNIVQKMSTDRIVRANVLLDYDRSQKLGLDYDRRKDNFEKVQTLTFADINAFYQKTIKDKSYTILVMGDKNKLDFKALEKYGKIEFLTLPQIFGYGMDQSTFKP